MDLASPAFPLPSRPSATCFSLPDSLKVVNWQLIALRLEVIRAKEERDERASSDSISSSEDGGAYSNGRLEDATIEEEFPGFLTMLQLPGFPGTRTAPEPDFPLEVIPHIFVASHVSHASDEVPTGPDEAMGSYECHCSCHQDSCHLCMCSKKRSKRSYVEHLYKGFILRKCFS